MIIGTCKVYLTAEWVNTLKDKRSVVKSLIAKMRNKFNISVAEVEAQDIHKTIVIGFCCVTNETAHADSIINNVLHFIENSTDAVVDNIDVQIL